MKAIALFSILTFTFLSTLHLHSQTFSTTFPANTVVVDEAGGTLTMRGVRTPASTLGTLRLIPTAPAVDARTEIVVMTAAGETRVMAPETRAYIGTIDGDPRSTVTVVHSGSKTYGIISEGSGATWVMSRTLGTPTYSITSGGGAAHPFDCVGFDEDEGQALPPTQIAGAPLREMEVAVETDREFFRATGGTIDDAVAYLSALMTSVSAIYQRDLGLVVTMSWARVWTEENPDPYGVAGDPYALTDSIGANWSAYDGIDRDILHVITSSENGSGGWGYYSTICGEDYDAHSTSSIQGYNDPSAPGFNYDTYTIAHELGHNLGARHTHSCYYGAPLDTCEVATGIEGGCLNQDQIQLPSPGSIMSYCGWANYHAGLGYQVAMYFPEPVAGPMRTYIESLSCLSLVSLPIPTTLAPVDDTVAVGAVPFSWSATWTGEYELELRGADAGTATINRNDTVLTLDAGAYEWRVRSIMQGTIGEWSGWAEFVVSDDISSVESSTRRAKDLDLW